MSMDVLLDRVLRDVAHSETPEITGFLAMRGREYDGHLMIVGRAVNGWSENICPAELQDNERRGEFASVVHRSVSAVSSDHCPMSWVSDQWEAAKGYNTRRSAFWRVTRSVTERLAVSAGEDLWPSTLVWSNLYKIAPSDGGNPNSALRDAQFEGCVAILEKQHALFLPRRILFLTGRDWAEPFLRRMNGRESEQDPHERQYVEGAGILATEAGNFVRYVVAKHPQGKREAALVDEVVEAFGFRLV
jgi:hypothetical protein